LDVVIEVMLKIRETVVDIGGVALDEHLNGTVGEIPNKSRQFVPAGATMGRIAEAYALNTTLENDVFSRYRHTRQNTLKSKYDHNI
jgi:hypothetical protein